MFGRLRCHFCGQRSGHARGTTEFQCIGCEAPNFFDAKGEVVEAPYNVVNPPQQREPTRSTSPLPSFSRPSSQEGQQQSDLVFCQRCLNNQRMYMDALNSYLPDEDHPRYQEYMDKLPQKKAELETKYPQVCKKCAPKAQERIHQADYYGMTQQMAAAVGRTRARRGGSPVGQRDDWGKWFMRLLLSLIGMAVYGSLLVQLAWHAYGVCLSAFPATSTNDVEDLSLIFEPTLSVCAKQLLLLKFDAECHDLTTSSVKWSILASLSLIWYNNGLRDWYHNTYRVEAIHGQTEYFRIQVLLLISRAFALYKLSNQSFTVELSTQQLLASHAFMIALLLIGQRISERAVTSEKWKIRGKIMPKPSEQDIFGATAGPADEQYTRQASSKHPLKLFTRDERPFSIESLAPKQRNSRGYSKLDLTTIPPPSPPDTESVSGDDGEAMDLDTPPSRTAGIPGAPIDRTFRPKNYGASKPQTRSLYNHGTTQPSGWGAMRNEVFGMEDSLRTEAERKQQEQEKRSKLRFEPPVEQSPFRGRLPQAPMSMGRRLRNPPTQVSFKQTPLSKQQDFMQQMRSSYENGTTFGKGNTTKSHSSFPARHGLDEEDEDFSPAKNRTRGNLDLKPGSWHLPGDAAQTTGLEDLLGGKAFAIADEYEREDPATATPQPKSFPWVWLVAMLSPMVIVLGWSIPAVRRPICLWLVGKMEEYVI